MTLVDRIAGAIGGTDHLERFMRGEANFDNERSPDLQRWNDLAGAAPPEDLRASIAEAARQVDGREYAEHITPGAGGTDPLGGAGGTDPLGGLGQGTLATLARSLLRSPADVAAVANYLRQRNPEAFGRAAEEVGRTHPNALQSLLGNKALMLGAAILAAKVMAGRQRRTA